MDFLPVESPAILAWPCRIPSPLASAHVARGKSEFYFRFDSIVAAHIKCRMLEISPRIRSEDLAALAAPERLVYLRSRLDGLSCSRTASASRGNSSSIGSASAISTSTWSRSIPAGCFRKLTNYGRRPNAVTAAASAPSIPTARRWSGSSPSRASTASTNRNAHARPAATCAKRGRSTARLAGPRPGSPACAPTRTITGATRALPHTMARAG